jgi:hypothetical protein
MLLLNPEQHRDLHLTPIDNGWLALGQGAIPLVFDDLQALSGRCPVAVTVKVSDSLPQPFFCHQSTQNEREWEPPTPIFVIRRHLFS